ncbi:uncharacterized protein [Panulirus ornatus]|uniref:uncharacterized protein isoform X3 n=1 Tax=Panulirus ornatus TaxID=150431 RepID=UPI003A847A1D
MHLLKKLDFPSLEYSLYSMSFETVQNIAQDEIERRKWCFTQDATLELPQFSLSLMSFIDWGTEVDANFPGYHSGNSDPRGFVHIRIMVPDVEKACEKLESLGAKYVKEPRDGKYYHEHYAFNICI